MTTINPRPGRARRPTRRTTLVALLTAALLVVAGGTAWAYWTATATGTGTVTTNSVAITQTGFPAIGATYRNHQLTSTGSFTVTNTGQVAGNASIAIETVPGGVAALLPIRVWSVANAAACTTGTTLPTSAAAGTWASFSLTGGVALAAGQSVTYCVRTTAPTRQSIATAAGSSTSQPELRVIFDDNEGWDGTRTVTPTTTVATELIYPFPTVGTPNYVRTGVSDWFTIKRDATPTMCLDVSGSGGSGSNVLSWGCHADPNQRWQIMPATDLGAGTSLVRLRPRHSSALTTRLSVNASNQVSIQPSNNNSQDQLWEFQRISATTFQLVAHGSGRCLNMTPAPNSETALTVSACSPAARASQVLRLTREPLTFTTSGNDVVLNYNSEKTANNGSPGYQLQRQNRGSWTNVGGASAGAATSLSVPTSTAALSEGPHVYRIIDSGTAEVLYSNITLTKTTTTTPTTTNKCIRWFIVCLEYETVTTYTDTYVVTQSGGFD